MTERNETIYETAKFYKDKNIPIHITLKSSDWLNGKIMSVSKDRLILHEEKFGEMLVLFERIKEDGIIPREVRLWNVVKNVIQILK